MKRSDCYYGGSSNVVLYWNVPLAVNWTSHLADMGLVSLIIGFNTHWFRVCKGMSFLSTYLAVDRKSSSTDWSIYNLSENVFIFNVGHTSKPWWAVSWNTSQCISAQQCWGQRDLSNAATGVRCWAHFHGRTVKHDRVRQCCDMEWYTPQDLHHWTVSRMVNAFFSVWCQL